ARARAGTGAPGPRCRTGIDAPRDGPAGQGRSGQLWEEQGIVDYLEDYRQRRSPAPATYHRRFVLVRRFIRWASQRKGLRDPFLELEPPAKPRQESDWLTRAELIRLLAAAEHPVRRRPGLLERAKPV